MSDDYALREDELDRQHQANRAHFGHATPTATSLTLEGTLRRDTGWYASDDVPDGYLSIDSEMLEHVLMNALSWVDDATPDRVTAGRVRITVEVLEAPDAEALAQRRAAQLAEREAEGLRWRAEHPEEAARNDEFVRMMILLTDLQLGLSLPPEQQTYPIFSPLRSRVVRSGSGEPPEATEEATRAKRD